MASNALHSSSESPSAVPEHILDSGTSAIQADHRLDSRFGSRKSSSRKHPQPTYDSRPDQFQPLLPYHDYVRSLAKAGWTNLIDLDKYMSTRQAPQSSVVSVLDITTESQIHSWPEIHNELELQRFLADHGNRKGTNVRLCLVEYHGIPSASLIEILGSNLRLDPRFFQWSIHSTGHVFMESQRRRAPYCTLDFGVLKDNVSRRTDTENFKVLVYIQPDDVGDGWTGVILFSSCTKINISPRILSEPPPFKSELPPSTNHQPKSFREIYIESFESINLSAAVSSPFYTISNLLRLNAFCWNQIITAVRDEDSRINGISDMSIGHMEEIKKSLSVSQRSGSLSWPGRDQAATKEVREELEEDFTYLVGQTNLVWENRKKMEKVRSRNADTRWASLTNAFTYGFAPVTIMTGVYGMNVSEISGDGANPNIWQFFVAVASLSIIAVSVFSISSWINIERRHKRKAGLKEVLGLAVGNLNSRS